MRAFLKDSYTKKVGESLLYILLFFTPLFFDIRAEGLYDIPKLSLLYGLSILSSSFFIAHFCRERRLEVVQNRVFYVVTGFLFANFISILLSASPFLSIFGLYRRYDGLTTLLCYSLLFFLFANWTDLRRTVYVVLATATVSSVYAISQQLGFYIIPSASERVGSLFGNPNFLSAYLLMAFPLGLSLFLKERRLFGVVSLLILIAIFLTKTRAVFLGLLVQLPFLLILIRREAKRDRLILLLAVTLIATIVFGKGTIERLILTSFTEERIGLWKGAFSVFCKNLFFGTGPEALSFEVSKNMPEELVKQYKGAYIFVDKAHNEFLDIAATRGIFALILWIALLFSVFKIGFSTKRDKLLVFAILSSILGYLIQAQFNLSYFSVTHLLWVMMGLIVSRETKKKKVWLRHPKLILILAIVATLLCLWNIYRFWAADIAFHKAKVYKSEKWFLQAERLNPREPHYARKHMQFLLDSDRKGELFRLEKEYHWLLKSDPRFWYILAQSTESIVYYKKAISLSPFWADPYNNLAILYINRGEVDKAERYFEKAFYLNPESKIYKENLANLYNQLAYRAYENSNLNRALFYYRKRAELLPEDISALKNMGTIYIEQKNYRKAEEVFLKILSLCQDEYAKKMVEWLKQRMVE